MKTSDIKKDKIKSIRYSSEVEKRLKEIGFKSIQDFLDKKINAQFEIELKDNELVSDLQVSR